MGSLGRGESGKGIHNGNPSVLVRWGVFFILRIRRRRMGGGWLGGRRPGFGLSHLFLLRNLFLLLTFFNLTFVIYDFSMGLSFGRTRSCCLGRCSDLWRSSTGGCIVPRFLATEALLLLPHAFFFIGGELWEVLHMDGGQLLTIDVHRNTWGEGLTRHESLVGVPS